MNAGLNCKSIDGLFGSLGYKVEELASRLGYAGRPIGGIEEGCSLCIGWLT
jgi:hypothetical protein